MLKVIEPAHVADAMRRLQGVVNRTPVVTSRTLNRETGLEVFLKCENFQRGGAFKFRGAYNALSQLTTKQKKAGVITHSSGNHAQGVALAAKLLGVRAIIVMPHDAPTIKRAATVDYGAEIIPCQAIDRETVTERLLLEHSYTLIHPYDNDHIIAGQGTAAWELFEEVGDLDYLFVPVGGGGLVSGCGLATASQSPNCQVVGVEPEVAADANISWREGRIHSLSQVPDTIADGLRPLHIGERNLAIMGQTIADMTTVSEREIYQAFKFIWDRLKIIVEPSAAVALAPLLHRRYLGQNKRVGVILSGGNLDMKNPILCNPAVAYTS